MLSWSFFPNFGQGPVPKIAGKSPAILTSAAEEGRDLSVNSFVFFHHLPLVDLEKLSDWSNFTEP